MGLQVVWVWLLKRGGSGINHHVLDISDQAHQDVRCVNTFAYYWTIFIWLICQLLFDDFTDRSLYVDVKMSKQNWNKQ